MRNKIFRLAEILLLVCTVICGTFFLVSCKKDKDSESISSDSASESVSDLPQKDEVTVSLVSDTYEVTKVKSKVGAELPRLDVADKDFEGYWTDSTYSVKYAYTTTPSVDVTLYYKLSYQTYSIELVYGNDETLSYRARRGVSEKLPSVSPVGTKLIGYSETKGGELKYSVDDPESNTVKNIAEKGGKAVLYAVYEIDDAADFTIENGVVKGYTGTKTEITLPYGASEVAAEAFKDNTTLKKVTVPSVYVSIGKGAFSGCKSLETLNVPFIGGSRTSNRFLAYIFGADKYEDNTFSFAAYVMSSSLYMGDMHFETLIIPQSFKTIVITEKTYEVPEGAFYSAYSLENVTFVYPEEVKSVGKKAFMNCVCLGYDSGIKTYIQFDWLAYVETIGVNAFTAYYGNYESSVKEIYPYGEDYKDYVAELVEYPYPFSYLGKIPKLENIVEIGEEGFSYCAFIQDLEFGNKLKKIGKNAFFYNMVNDELVLPDSLTEIGEQAFYANMALYGVTFGTGIKTIKARAFANCSSLSQIEFKGDEAPTVENYVFCNTLTSKDAPSGSSIIYEATYDEINVLVPANSLDDYKDVLPALGDKIVTPQPLSDPIYWFNENGELAAKFEFAQGGVVNVTDKDQQFILSVDFGNGSTPTYSATCGDYYPMNYEFLSEEEYNGISHLASKTVDTNGYGYVGINAASVPDVWMRRAIIKSMNTAMTVEYFTTNLASQIYRPMSKQSWAYPEDKTSSFSFTDDDGYYR